MIEVRELTKVFGEKVAVDCLSFSVNKGRILGLIGPNGAGKSTTMKMVTGCLKPTKGRILLKGHDVWKTPIIAKKHLGYLPENAPSYDDLTVDEFLRYIGEIRGLSGGSLHRALDRVVDLCFLQAVRRQSIETLSKGYRHRICLAQSIIHDPDIIVFDEPTDGLDPNQKTEIRRLVEQIRPDKAVILSTHILDEVEALCTDIILINHGKRIVESTPEKLRLESGEERIVVLKFEGGAEPCVAELGKLEKVASVRVVTEDTLHLTTGLQSQFGLNEFLGEIHRQATARDWPLLQIFIQEPKLEDVFRNLTFKRPTGSPHV